MNAPNLATLWCAPLRLSRLAGALVVFALPAFAASFSYQGTFVHDNDVEMIAFNLLSSATVTLQTWGYGGGTNANLQVIPTGGFESILQVYDANTGIASSGPIFPGPAPTCPPRNPDPNRNDYCLDAYGQLLLGPGNYLLALTQDANAPNGNLSDGFFYVDTIPDPNFNNGFVGTFGFQGNGNWAVDIVVVDSVPAVAPEPASVLLAAGAFLYFGFRARRL